MNRTIPAHRGFPMPHRFLPFLAAAVLTFAWISVSSASPFGFKAENEPLPNLLCSFAASQGKGCQVSPKIDGVISGDLNFRSGDAFLAFIERGRDIVAYTDASMIFFYDKSEMQSTLITVGNITTDRIIEALRELRAYDPRYPLLPLSGGRMIRLVAPPAYIEMVRSLVGDLEATYSAKRATRVFRLKHAWAADVTLTFMDKDTTVPGVASLLRDITNGGQSAPTSAPSAETNRATRLKGTGLTRSSGSVAPGQAPPPPSGDGGARKGGDGARIMADPRLNAVIIWDEEQLMPMYETLIEELDRPVPLVEIRTAIVDVSVSRVFELGFAWNVDARSNAKWGAVGGANVGTGDNAIDFTSPQGSGLNMTTIFKDGLDTFMGRVKALEEDGDAAVLSRPVVLTLDNIQANLEVTNTFYIEVAGQEEVDLFDVTYGTILKVTPHVIEDEKTGRTLIKLIVHIEDGGSHAAPTGSGLNYPVVSRATINTQAMVADGEMMVVGGHYYESDTGGDSGVPGLKSFPLLGNLFKTNSDNFQKQERLFLIAPRLVSQEDLLAQQRQYAPVFDRDMNSPRRFTRTMGGCGKRTQVAYTQVQDVDTSMRTATPFGAPVQAPAEGSTDQ